jgi:beta-N-acetylhexosaminidase
VIRTLLRRQLGFRGVVLSDDLGETKAVADVPPADRAIRFLQAGGDLIISKTLGPAEEMASALVSKAARDPKFRARVSDAALRVLEAKERAGLLPCGGD